MTFPEHWLMASFDVPSVPEMRDIIRRLAQGATDETIITIYRHYRAAMASGLIVEVVNHDAVSHGGWSDEEPMVELSVAADGTLTGRLDLEAGGTHRLLTQEDLRDRAASLDVPREPDHEAALRALPHPTLVLDIMQSWKEGNGGESKRKRDPDDWSSD